MKKGLLLMALAACSLTACDNFHTSGNGSLDGYWQMTHVDTLATGNSADMTSRMIFWAVQSELIELSDRHDADQDDTRYPSIFYHFERSAESLILLGDPKPRLGNRVNSDSEVASHDQCEYYGLNDRGDTLRILRLEAKKMTLESETLRMYFRKF